MDGPIFGARASFFTKCWPAKRPFQGQSEYHVIAHILESDPKPLSPAALSRPNKAHLSRCLEKERQRRYESAAELYGDLREARRALNLSSIASKAAISPPPVRLKRWYWIPVLAGLAVAAAADRRSSLGRTADGSRSLRVFRNRERSPTAAR